MPAMFVAAPCPGCQGNPGSTAERLIGRACYTVLAVCTIADRRHI